MRYLQRRMRTGVGTSGRNDCDTLARDLGQRALESILHSAAVGLRLPAVKRRAVVFESERDAHIRREWLTQRSPSGAFAACVATLENTRGGGSTIHRPFTRSVVADQASLVTKAWASAFCSSSPSCNTSCRISRAPSTSPIS